VGVNKRLVQMNNLPLNPTLSIQVKILLCPTFQKRFRQSKIIIPSLIQTIIMSVLIGTIFLKIGNTQKKYCTS